MEILTHHFCKNCVSPTVKSQFNELYSKIKRVAKTLWSRESKQFFDFEDISQEMLLKLWDLCRSRETKLKDANLFYLLRILKYAARDSLYRKGKGIEKHLKILSLNEVINENGTELGEVLTTSDSSLPPDMYPFREYEREIRKGLSNKQNEILDLLFQGYKQIEIAKRFKENHQNISYHLKKIRKCIYQVLFRE